LSADIRRRPPRSRRPGIQVGRFRPMLGTVHGPSISTHEIIGSLPLKDLGATWLIPGVPMGVSDGQHR